MVALLTRLRWRLWRTEYRSKRRWITAIIGIVYTVPLIGLFWLALGALTREAPVMLPHVLVGAGAGIVLAWSTIPIVAFGLDDPLAANRFALLPRRARELQPGLLVAGLVSIPAVLTAIALIGALLLSEIALATWQGGDASMPGRILAMVIAPVSFGAGLALCLMVPRALLAATSAGGVSRRRRELGSALGLAGLLGLTYAAMLWGAPVLENASGEELTRALTTVATIAAWTPFGAPFALPFDIASVAWLAAAGRAVIVAASVAGVWLWWERALSEALVSGPQNQSARRARRAGGAGIMRLLPASPLGAVIGRSLRTWVRDSRYSLGLLISPLVVGFLVGMALINDNPSTIPIAGFMLALTLQPILNDFGYDGPAMWHSIVHDADPRANIRGRGIAALLVISPMLLILAVVLVWVTGSLRAIATYGPWIVGAAFSATGAAAIVSPLLPYAVQPPGTNAFKGNAAQGAGAWISAIVGMVAITVPLLPAGVLFLGGFLRPSWAAAAPWVALAGGTIMLVVGWILGPKLLQERQVDIYHRVRIWAT